MAKATHPLMHLLILALYALMLLLCASALSMTMGAVSPSNPDTVNTYLLWQGLTQVMAFAIPVLLLTWRYYRENQREYYRLDFGRRRWLLAVAGLAVMLLLMPFTDWINTCNKALHLPEALAGVERRLREMSEMSEQTVAQMLVHGNPLLALLCAALLPALCEELFFRAGAQNLLQRWFGNVHVAVWVTAAVFSLAHLDPFAFLPRLLLGALLGYLYVGGGSLLVNVTAHFVNNAIVVTAYCLTGRGVLHFDPAAPMDFGWPTILCCTAAAVAVFIITFGKSLKISR